MLRRVVWNLHLLGNSIPTGNGGLARIQLRPVNTLTATVGISLERITRKPVITPTSLVLRAVRAISTLLPVNIRTLQLALQETVLGGLLLVLCREVVRVQELVDQGLVLADAVGEHAAVVAVIVDAPLHLDHVAGRIGLHDLIAPVVAGLVVVDAHAGVVAAGSAAADLGAFEVGPG